MLLLSCGVPASGRGHEKDARSRAGHAPAQIAGRTTAAVAILSPFPCLTGRLSLADNGTQPGPARNRRVLTRHQRDVGHWEIDENRAIDTASHL